MRAIFLDRDGVLHVDRPDYVKNPAELEIFDYVPLAIRRLNELGLPVIVVSNQQGVGKGVMTRQDLADVEAEIVRRVGEAGAKIDAFRYCTHLDKEQCACRKPRPGLLLMAAEEYGLDLAGSVMVGDSERDIAAGKSAGCKTVLVLSGKLKREDVGQMASAPDKVTETLKDVVEFIANVEENG